MRTVFARGLIFCWITVGVLLAQNTYDSVIQNVRILITQKHLNDAASEAARAISMDRTRWEGYALAAIAYQDQNSCRTAIPYFQDALSRAPENVKTTIRHSLQECRDSETAEQQVAATQSAAGEADAASIHGHAQDPANFPIANSQVVLSHDGRTPLYTFSVDANGNYRGSGIKPDTYYVTLFATPGKAVDRADNVTFTPGTDTLQDFDLSRIEYISKLPPDQRKALEDARAKNADINKQNQNVSKLNDLLIQARADNAAKKFDEAAMLMNQATAIKQDASVLWLELGIAQTGQKSYENAAASLQKSLDLDSHSQRPNPQIDAAANNALGEVYASTNRIPDATAAYEAAASLQPANAAMFFTNETIVLSRAGQTDAVIAAADKAIAADPTKPIPYYLKGQALISKATVDPKTQKIVAPPGTAEAYNKYLQLAPNGPMALLAQRILSEIGKR